MSLRKELASPVLALAVALVMGSLLACVDTGEVAEIDEAAIQTALDLYAPRLAKAYSIGDLEALRAYSREHGIEDPLVKEILELHTEATVPPLRERIASALTGHAAEKEIAGMEKRIGDLLVESRVIRPTVKSVQVEDVQIWNYANAFVTTLEVWDLRVYAAGTDQVLSEALDQTNRVKYQMKRERQDKWLVLFRELDTTFE
ncbi:MAG: hypothetical protein VYE73_01465 [Acidobacteriota bacterium]|nr:hypothetical protein [Acidobacteriota bacterium]